ncbi:MAG: hypothetical protein WCB27_20560 [Thermoguttaceae bacterium]
MATAASQERRRLFHANCERIEFLYDRSLKEGIVRPVIFMLDIRDRAARAMAEDLAGEEAVKQHQALAEENKVDFCLLYPLSQQDAASAVASWPSQGKSILDDFRPTEEFVVVAVGGGGISWIPHKNPE